MNTTFSQHRSLFTPASRRVITIALCLLCLFLFSGQSLAGQIIRFGWYPGGTLSLNTNRATALSKYLSSRLKMEVMPVRVQSLKELKKGLKDNSIDVASIPNFSYPTLLKSVHLLATSKFENKKRMFLYIIANKKSGIKKVEDLKGSSAAQVMDNNKLKCYFLAESIKANPQEYLSRIEVYTDLRDAVNAVAEGTIDSTCLSSTAWEILTRFDPSLKQTIRIIKRSPAYAMDPIVASKKLHESIWWNIQSVLIAMSRDYAAQQILMQMGVQGFGSPVTDLSAYPTIVRSIEHKIAIPVAHDRKKRPVPQENKQNDDISITAANAPKSSVKSEDTAPQLPKKNKKVEITDIQVPEVQTTAPTPKTVVTEAPSKPITETAQAAIAPSKLLPGPTDLRSMFRKGLDNQLYMKGGLIFLILILGITILSMMRRCCRNKTLTVLLRMDNQMAALRSSLDWKGKLHIESCHISEGLDKDAIVTLLNSIGHQGAMKLALILNSDRIIVQEFTFPLLTDNEIPAAIHWKLQDLNVPYDKETDIIHHTLTKKDRKLKQISLMAMIQPKEEEGQGQWSGLPVKPDATLCVQMALLSRFRKCSPAKWNARIMLAYRLNEQEAQVLILQGDNSFISRRIYATGETLVAANHAELEFTPSSGVTDVWEPFIPELEQTINFQNRSSGNSLQTIYLSGLGVSDTPDPDGDLAQRFGVAVEGIDFLSDIEVSDGVREGCPAIEVLAGAALIYHKQAK